MGKIQKYGLENYDFMMKEFLAPSRLAMALLFHHLLSSLPRKALLWKFSATDDSRRDLSPSLIKNRETSVDGVEFGAVTASFLFERPLYPMEGTILRDLADAPFLRSYKQNSLRIQSYIDNAFFLSAIAVNIVD